MPRDFPHGAMLAGRRKDTKDLSFFFLYRSRVALLWLALFSVAGTQGLHFPCKYRTGRARVVEKNLGDVFERLLSARSLTWLPRLKV
jgi:hypothetical protein